jgi:hypothetical protein
MTLTVLVLSVFAVIIRTVLSAEAQTRAGSEELTLVGSP